MKKYKSFFLLLMGVALLAAGCTKHELPREVPSSPAESYQNLPK